MQNQKKGKYRKAVFIVTYCRTANKIEYLILKRKLHWQGWEFPKGGVEKRENTFQTAKRETKEETGQKPFQIKKFNVKGRYRYRRKYPDRLKYLGQSWQLFAVRIKKGKIKIDKREHSVYRWLDFKKAYKILRWPNQKKCLKIVNSYLGKK